MRWIDSDGVQTDEDDREPAWWPDFSPEARWRRLLAAAQLHYHQHLDGRSAPPAGCQVCRVYLGDFWD